MERTPGRRRFLQLAGTGTALSLAGCASLGDDDESLPEADNGTEEPAASTDGVAMLSEPSQEALEAMQQELFEEIEEGEIAEEEAQAAMQERQMELTAELVEDILADIEDGPLTVVESEPEFGLVLIEGDADAKLALLEREDVTALLSGADFAEMQEQIGATQP